MKATYLSILLMLALSLILAGVMGYSAYCHITSKPIAWYVGAIGGVTALLLVAVGRMFRIPGRD
jgi:hypothetical protein